MQRKVNKVTLWMLAVELWRAFLLPQCPHQIFSIESLMSFIHFYVISNRSSICGSVFAYMISGSGLSALHKILVKLQKILPLAPFSETVIFFVLLRP